MKLNEQEFSVVLEGFFKCPIKANWFFKIEANGKVELFLQE